LPAVRVVRYVNEEAYEIAVKPKTIIAVVLAVLVLVIVVQNTYIVTVQFFFWRLYMSRIILILIMLVIGVVIGYIIGKIPRKQR
jgi:uncharacterized integral membrane protein